MFTAQLKNIKKQQGFTLIELLVVIGILAILLAITLIAINPARQFGQANNTRRRSDITQVLNAIGAYEADNKGVLPKTDAGAALTSTPVDAYNLCASLMPNYIPSIPVDPTANSGNPYTTCGVAGDATLYMVSVDANNRVTVTASKTDNGDTISVTR